MLVYAYDRGGATMAGLVALIQLVPAALFAPFASVLADRYRPALVLTLSYVAQGIAMGATAAVLILGGPSWLAYVTAAVAATAVVVTRPTVATLIPALARVPEELTAANVVSGWIESISVLIAPAVAGLLIAAWGPGWVFLLMGASCSSAQCSSCRSKAAGCRSGRRRRHVAELLEGFHVLRDEPQARLLVGLLGSQYVAIGMLDVLYVVLAIDTLGMGQGGAGYLNAAFGAGGALGIAFTASLVGRARLMPAVDHLARRLGRRLRGDDRLVAGRRGAAPARGRRGRAQPVRRCRTHAPAANGPADVLARVFGILEALIMAGTAVGALIAPVLVNLGGATAAIVGVGVDAAAPRAARRPAASRARRVRARAGRRDRLLRSLRLFAALPPPAIEGLARSLVPGRAGAGEVIMRQGDEGDRYYAIAEASSRCSSTASGSNTLGARRRLRRDRAAPRRCRGRPRCRL